MSGTVLNEKVLGCVYEALDEGNEDRLSRDLPPLEKSLDTAIHGTESGFDSLGLVNFVVAVEECLERDFDVALVLSDDRAMSQDPSPFESIRRLVEYIDTLLGEQQP